MAYDIKTKFKKNSPLPCWKGYERVSGTTSRSKGSCRKSSPVKVRKTKAGANLKRWFKEDWKDEKGNECGSSENKNTKVCRPSKTISSESPKTWAQMSSSEKSKVVNAKKKVGMGNRRSSSSNVA
tara:strand:+ start:283 stop:657 length:375 start_codon:yes stop_codon:yes gene_type:complete